MEIVILQGWKRKNLNSILRLPRLKNCLQVHMHMADFLVFFGSASSSCKLIFLVPLAPPATICLVPLVHPLSCIVVLVNCPSNPVNAEHGI